MLRWLQNVGFLRKQRNEGLGARPVSCQSGSGFFAWTNYFSVEMEWNYLFECSSEPGLLIFQSLAYDNLPRPHTVFCMPLTKIVRPSGRWRNTILVVFLVHIWTLISLFSTKLWTKICLANISMLWARPSWTSAVSVKASCYSHW